VEYKVGDRINYKEFSYMSSKNKFKLGFDLIATLLGFHFEAGSGVIVDTQNVLTNGVEVLAYFVLTDDLDVFAISELVMELVVEKVNGKNKKTAS